MIPMADKAQIDSTTFARKGSRMWGLELHSWEQIMLWSLGAAALAALAVTISTTAVVFLQKDESEASRQELERYKADAGAKISAAEAVKQAAQAEVGKANAQIATANERSAALEKETAVARLEQERIKQIVNWRILSPEALRRFTAKLQRGGTATIAYAANDPEALYLWTQITKAIPQPAWKMKSQARTYEGVLYAGIFIFGPQGPSLDALRDAFAAAGLAFGTDDPGMPHLWFGDPIDPTIPTVYIASKIPAVPEANSRK
jgi:hypothetical protein